MSILISVVRAVLVVLIAYSATFLLIHGLPKDGVDILTSSLDGLTQDRIEALKEYYGLDRPLWEQYFIQLGNLLRGDLGYSIFSGRPVLTDITSVMGHTAALAGATLAVTFLVVAGIVLAATLTRRPWLRTALRNLPPLLGSIPAFWLGLVALQLLSFRLKALSIFPDGSFLSLFVPALVLAIPLSASITQVVLKRADEIVGQPFVHTARAKGASERQLHFGHVYKNASGPAVTLLAILFGNLLIGTVVVETVFNRPGIGTLLQQAVTRADIAVVQGVVILAAVVFTVLNLLVDLLYPLLDPRVSAFRRRQEVSYGVA